MPGGGGLGLFVAHLRPLLVMKMHTLLPWRPPTLSRRSDQHRNEILFTALFLSTSTERRQPCPMSAVKVRTRVILPRMRLIAWAYSANRWDAKGAIASVPFGAFLRNLHVTELLWRLKYRACCKRLVLLAENKRKVETISVCFFREVSKYIIVCTLYNTWYWFQPLSPYTNSVERTPWRPESHLPKTISLKMAKEMWTHLDRVSVQYSKGRQECENAFHLT
jgi:hypothetical protein